MRVSSNSTLEETKLIFFCKITVKSRIIGLNSFGQEEYHDVMKTTKCRVQKPNGKCSRTQYVGSISKVFRIKDWYSGETRSNATYYLE